MNRREKEFLDTMESVFGKNVPEYERRIMFKGWMLCWNMLRDNPLADPKEPLSRMEQRVLDFVVLYHDKKGFSPSYRDIAKAIGYTSLKGIGVILHSLEKKGCVVLDPEVSRGLKIMRRVDHSFHSKSEDAP